MHAGPFLDTTLPIHWADPVNRAHPLNRGRIAWYLAHPTKSRGLTWFNLTGTSHGTLTNMVQGSTSGWQGTTRPGGFGHLLFDGTDDRIVIAPPAPPGAHTMAAWVRLDAAGSYPQITSSNLSHELRYNGSSRQPEYFLNNEAVTAPFASAVTLGDWHRIVGMYDVATVSIWVDGLQKASIAATGYTATAASRIGCRSNDSLFLTGAIDDFTIWSRALSAAEMTADFNLGRQGYPGVLNRYRSSVATFVIPATSTIAPLASILNRKRRAG